ncbi:MAG TPA: CinA family protein [Candidatus Aquabacterium excrementipullorum]|nr:CinA family protein [Candidatus Aquabacterium excrementipullorum]
MSDAAVDTTLAVSAQTAVRALVAELAQALPAQGWLLATAESCTGGLIAASCTDLAGSSAWFDRAVVSYSNEAKTELLGVDAALITAHGAVSEPVARAMAEGVLARSKAEVAVAVTGIAGPGGGSAEKPVGTVWLAWARRGEATRADKHVFAGDRNAVRWQTCEVALRGVLAMAQGAAATGR